MLRLVKNAPEDFLTKNKKTWASKVILALTIKVHFIRKICWINL